MEKLFELTFQDQTLNPQVGTFTDASQATGTFTMEDGEYYLTNGDTKGFYTYAPIAIQPDSETDNKVTIEFDLKVVTASVNTHTIIGTYAGVDGSGIPTGAKITLQYNAGDIELVLGSGTTATLIESADVVVDQWYHFCIGCALAPTESTYEVKIDGILVTTVTGATTDYELGIISVLGTDLHACDECGIKNIRLITNDDYFVGRTALNQALTDTKGYVDNQVGACVPLAGTNALSGSIVPDTDNAYNLGDSTYGFASFYVNKIYLKGGTIFNLVDDNYICVGGATAQANGANIVLNGKDRSTSTGEFKLEARDGINTKQLIGKPDGTLSWSGVQIESSSLNASIGMAVDNLYMSLRGSTSWNGGGAISLYGKNSGSNTGAFRAEAHNGTTDHYLVGRPDGALIWDGSPITYASDRRIKDEIESISDDVLNAWENLEPKQYKLKSDLETDKENAQVHYGWIAQDVESIIKGDRKGEVKNGLWLHESWEEQEEVSHEETYTEESQTKDGITKTVTKTRKVIGQPYRAKGDSYSLRYTECLVVECAYLRKKLKELTARIEQLEKGNKEVKK